MWVFPLKIKENILVKKKSNSESILTLNRGLKVQNYYEYERGLLRGLTVSLAVEKMDETWRGRINELQTMHDSELRFWKWFWRYRPKSSLPYSCIFPVAKYVNIVNVVITSISGAMAFLHGVGDASMSLIRWVTNMIPARSIVATLLTHCHALCATHFFSLFIFHPCFSMVIVSLLIFYKIC